MIEIFAILLMGLVPPIISLLVVRVAEERIRVRLQSVMQQPNLPRIRRTYLASDGDSASAVSGMPDGRLSVRRFVSGFSHCMGNTTCRFNAHSAYLRCAVNPSGPCEGCLHYESIDLHRPSIAQS
jgi:hypothetical protein